MLFMHGKTGKTCPIGMMCCRICANMILQSLVDYGLVSFAIIRLQCYVSRLRILEGTL